MSEDDKFKWSDFQPPTLATFEGAYASAKKPFDDAYRRSVLSVAISEISEVCENGELSPDVRLDRVKQIVASARTLI